MRYVKYRYITDAEEMAYRIYISDSLQAQGEGKYITKRYYEIIRPTEQVDEKSADEIAVNIIKGMGLKIE